MNCKADDVLRESIDGWPRHVRITTNNRASASTMPGAANSSAVLDGGAELLRWS
jgi:hypothetical protein